MFKIVPKILNEINNIKKEIERTEELKAKNKPNDNAVKEVNKILTADLCILR